MADQFLIIPPQVRAAGTDVPPEQIQAALNSIAQQVTLALNTLVGEPEPPSGPAGGDLSGTYPNPTVAKVNGVAAGTMANQNANAVAITGGTITNTPISGSTVAGTSVFASGGAVPAVTTTGTQVYNSPNPTVQFIDSVRSAGNKNAYATWGSTVLALGFANDAFTSFTNALSITGGFTSGISGITSNSGSGTWAHTGAFSATSFTVTNAIGVASGGTGRQTLTAHGVLLGEGTAAINQTTAGTAGQTLVSGGASADPAFGVAGVNGGGTGLATLTAHAVVVGEGTSNVGLVGPGTTGQMLIGVTGSDPAFGNTVSTLTATGAITPSSTAGIVGTTTNDNANAGSIGEYVTANTTSVTGIVNNTATNILSISLTAGDWQLSGAVLYLPQTGDTLTTILTGFNTTSAATPAWSSFPYHQNGSISIGAGSGISATPPPQRISLSSTTTVYLIGFASHSGGTLNASGFISARRVR